MSDTTNYNFPLYDSTDKPNLRDQYNGAITMIDTELTNQNAAIENTYTKTEVDTKLEGYYTEGEVDGKLGNYYTKTESDDKYEPMAVDQTELVVCGDSIMYGTGQTTSLGSRIATALGLTLHNYAVNQAGFTFPGTSGSDTILEQLTKAKGAVDVTKVKYVVIAAGVNDSSSTEAAHLPNATKAAAQTALQYAVTNFPHSEVHFIPMLVANTPMMPWQNNNLSGSITTVTKAQWYAALCQAANSVAGVHLIEGGYAVTYGETSMTSDNIHPNDNGSDEMSKYISNAIVNKGSIFPVKSALIDISGVATSNPQSFAYAETHNGMVYISFALKTSKQLGSNTNIFKVPAWARPQSQKYVGLGATEMGYISVGSSGLNTAPGVNLNADSFICGYETHMMGF